MSATLLEVTGLTKRFGGVAANREISFAVRPGELVGVIGPNGAGKSTLFDLVTGFTRPDAGRVRLDGRDATGLRPDQICRLGVGRTFQKLRPFHAMTALEQNRDHVPAEISRCACDEHILRHG